MTKYMQLPDGRVFDTENPEYYKDCKVLKVADGKRLLCEQYKADLRNILKPGMTVQCNLRSVSRSGMSREISLHVVSDGEIKDITFMASKVMGDNIGSRGGLKIGGCGMDMGFHTVYTLGRYLFPDGFGIIGELDNGKKPKVIAAAATKEQAEAMVKQGFKFRGRNGDSSGWDNDGGYALKHNWM